MGRSWPLRAWARPAAALLLLAAAVAPCVGLPSRVRGREILAGDEVLVFKGVNWNPVAVGKEQKKHGVDFRGFVEADSALMAAAGINVIRTYAPIMDREVLDILWQRGIHVLNTVYVDADEKVESAAKPVQELKDHPAILMWCIGNEWNYNRLYSPTMLFDDAVSRVAEVSKLIKRLDPTHLVATIYGMLPPLTEIETLDDVDVWGLTAYTGISFGSLFDLWEQRSRKPMFLAEFGADAYNAKAKVEDEDAQAHATTQLAQEISDNSVRTGGVCSGGLIFELADEWWKDPEGSPDRQDVGGIAPGGGPYPDHVFNEEYWGLVKIDGSPRSAFSAYAALDPVGNGTDEIGAGFRLRACGSSPDCSGMLGDCCPTAEDEFRDCCSAEALRAAKGEAPEVMTSAEGEACDIEHNYDYLGDDLQSIGHVDSLKKCAALCSLNPLCKSFTYGKVGYFENTCYLKKSTKPGRRTDACCDSGLPCSQAAKMEAANTSARLPAKSNATAPRNATSSPKSSANATTPPATAENRTTEAPSTAENRTTEACEIDRDHDYLGDDLTSIMYVASAETCAALCSAHPSCKSFTYAKTLQGCYLKSSVRSGRRQSDCCDSGLPCAQACLVEHGYDYSGDDFADIANIESAEECAKRCGGNPLCKSFTYYGIAQVCYLKKSVMPGRTSSSCCDSGLPCAPAPPPPGAKEEPATPSPTSAGASRKGEPEREGDWIDVQVTTDHEFVTSMSVGNPPQELRCLIDSGAADIWIPSERCRTCGSTNTFEARSSKSFAPEDAHTAFGNLRWPKSVRLAVGTGDITGYPVRDTVRVGPLQVENQTFIIVEDSTMQPQRAWDGVCGLAWRQLGKVHNPLYTHIQDQGRRALFALVPRGTGRASLVVGAVPHSKIEEGSLVWVQAQPFQPGAASRWVQRTFWVTTGGLRIHKITPASARFLVDTGVREALLAPPKHYFNFITSLLPLGTFKRHCALDDDGKRVTCDCSILKEDLLPLQIHLGGQPFLMQVKDLFEKVQVPDEVQVADEIRLDGKEKCQLQVRPNPEASSRWNGMLEGMSGLMEGMEGLVDDPVPVHEVEDLVDGPAEQGMAPGVEKVDASLDSPEDAEDSELSPGSPFHLHSLGQPLHGHAPVDGEAEAEPTHVRQRQLNNWQDLLKAKARGDMLNGVSQTRGPSWAEVDDPMDELWVLGGKFLQGYVVVFDFDKALLGFARPAAWADVEANESSPTRPANASESSPTRVKPKTFQRLEEASPIAAAGARARPWRLPLAGVAFLATVLAVVLGSCRMAGRGLWRPFAYSSLGPSRQLELVVRAEDMTFDVDEAIL